MQGNPSIGVILAAGRGSRLKELSLEQPKPMITVNEVTIISNLIQNLIDAKIQEIVVVVGYMADKLRSHLAPFEKQVSLVFVENEIYDKTNNIYSLWLAKEYLKDGFYLFEADVFTEPAVLTNFLKAPGDDVMLVDKFTPNLNGTVVKFDDRKKVTGMFLNSDQKNGFVYDDAYKTVNFYKISSKLSQSYFLDKLERHIKQQDTGYYYELIIKEAIENGYDFYACETSGLKWYEIDTREDLEFAEKIFKR